MIRHCERPAGAKQSSAGLLRSLSLPRNDVWKWLLMGVVALSIASCGHKGNLKTPTQAERAALKKQKEAEKEAQESSSSSSGSSGSSSSGFLQWQQQ
jgi:predicted small lipoprotein YifL